MTATRIGICAVMIVVLCGCEERPKSKSRAEERQLTPEKSACLSRAGEKHLAVERELATRQVDALKAGRSTVELTLLERRMTEEICLEEAKCIATNELVLGVLFDSCLRRVEAARRGT